jgi:hypothetical protein
VIDTSLFPYSTFPIRLEQTDEHRICWFKDTVDLEKYLKRYKIDTKKIIVSNANEQPTQPSKTNKKEIRPRARKNNTGSTNKPRGRPKKLDSTPNTSSTTKSKRSRKK